MVDRFDLGHKAFPSGDCEEEQLRAVFLSPFFTALGWALGRHPLDTIRTRNWVSAPPSVEPQPKRTGPMRQRIMSELMRSADCTKRSAQIEAMKCHTED